MASSILQELRSGKGIHIPPVPILEEIFPVELIVEAFEQTGAWQQRERRVSHLFLLYVLIAWTMGTLCALKEVYAHLSRAIRWLHEADPDPLPCASTLSYRRQTLGIAPFAWLFAHACKPLCHPDTPGAFVLGRRLIAIDSKLFDVPDTPLNAAFFRPPEPTSSTPFPQIRLLSALELGSHAHIGAVLAPSTSSEMALVTQLLPFLPAQSLILQDSGYRGVWWIERLLQQGHDSITRLRSLDFPCRGPRLPDGSYLVPVRPTKQNRLCRPLTLRIIEYRLHPDIAEPLAAIRCSRMTSTLRPQRSPDEVYRLATTLLDPLQAPAALLAATYHERWELELVYDGMQEQQLSTARLQSLTPLTVAQEAWAMLLGHYALHAWMMRSAQLEPPLDADQLSLAHAISVLGTALGLGPVLDQTPVERWRPRLLQDLRASDDLVPPRRLRSYPRVLKASHLRFFVKQEYDHPFVLKHSDKTWKDFILILPFSSAALTPILRI